MKRRIAIAVMGALVCCLAAVIAIGQTPQAGEGPINTDRQVWQVRYHRNEQHKHNAKAVRLEIRLRGNAMNATLTMYKRVTGNQYEPTVVITNLTGTAPPGQGHGREKVPFELSKTNEPIVVKGYFYAGRDKASGTRLDDILCIRIIDTSRRPGTDDPCDLSPPDEDVLTEETPQDPLPYDGGN
jgi:hypothetical protein